jgi:hypothetical protein
MLKLTIHFIEIHETWAFAPGQISMAAPGILTSGFGVLESWKKSKPEFQHKLVLIITPSLHHSITPSVNVQ